MREITRIIAAAIIISQDNKILMWRKDPKQWGVYTDCWHIPGGGVEGNESLSQTLYREVLEEVGIDISHYRQEYIPIINTGTTGKTLKDTGEKVLCHMQFNVFKVYLSHKSEDIVCHLSDDLVEVRRFDKEEIKTVKQIPGGKEFFQEIGLI